MRKRTRYIIKLILPFFCVVIISTVLMFFVYNKGINAISRDVEATALHAASGVSSAIEATFNEVRTDSVSLAVQLSHESDLGTNRFISYNGAISNLLNLQLNTLNMLNPANGGGYIFSFSDDTVISKSTGSGDARTLYRDYFKINGLTYDEFKKTYSADYYASKVVALDTVEHMNECYSGWYILQSVPADPYTKTTGLVVMHLDDYVLGEYLSDGVADERALCILADENGRRIYRQGISAIWTENDIDSLLDDIRTLEDGLHYVSDYMVCINRTDTGMLLVTARKTTDALHNQNRFILIFVASSILMLGLSICFAMLTSRQNADSVWEIIGTLPGEMQDTDETNALALIRDSVRLLVNDRNTVREQNDRYGSVIDGIKLKRFLEGSYSSRSDLIRNGIQPGLIDNSAYYTLLMVRLRDSFSDVSVAVCDSVIHGEFQGVPMPVSANKNCAVYILPTSDCDTSDSIHHVSECIFEKLPSSVLVSGMLDNIMDIPSAYRSLLSVSAFTDFEAGHLIILPDLYPDNYPRDFDLHMFADERLANTVAAGNLQETKRIFAAMHTDIENSAPQAIRFYVYDLYRLAVHIAMQDNRPQIKNEFLMSVLSDTDSAFTDRARFEQYFDKISGYCADVCLNNGNRMDNSSSGLKNAVIEYVNAHFSEPDLSVSGIARHFNITDKYLSTYFREQTNEKLSNYIEKIRIEYACTLLRNPSISIEDTALRSGYWQTHTFRAAFKRVKGITPTDYRECGIDKKA